MRALACYFMAKAAQISLGSMVAVVPSTLIPVVIPPRPLKYVISAFQPALPPSLPPHLLPQSASARICQRGLGR